MDESGTGKVIQVLVATILVIAAVYMFSRIPGSVVADFVETATGGMIKIRAKAFDSSAAIEACRDFDRAMYMREAFEAEKFYGLFDRGIGEEKLREMVTLYCGAALELLDARNINRTATEIASDYGRVYGIDISEDRIREILNGDGRSAAEELSIYLSERIREAMEGE